jgi:hypothetical protein
MNLNYKEGNIDELVKALDAIEKEEQAKKVALNDEIKKLEKQTAPPQEKPLTREQKRALDRANQEVMDTFDSFAKRFFDYFINHEDPTCFWVTDKLKTMDAQWRLYCKKRNLKVHAYPMFKEYCDGLIKEYKEYKEGKESQPETLPKEEDGKLQSV